MLEWSDGLSKAAFVKADRCILVHLGSNYYPHGPHGPRVDPREVPPHPGSTSGGNLPVGSSESFAPVAGTGGGGCGLIPINFIFVCFCAPVWSALYPVAAGTGFLVFLLCLSLFRPMVLRLDPTAGDVAFVAALTVCLVVGFRLCREEQRWGEHAAYRIPRHFVRLLLLALLTMRWIQAPHVVPLPGERLFNPYWFFVPANQAVMAAIVVGAHFLLWTDNRIRRFWHWQLSTIWLRPGELEN